MVMVKQKKDSLTQNQMGYYAGQKVALLISTRTEMGYVAIVNNTHKGILYKNEVFQPLKIGQELDGFIKKVRENNMLDLCLQKSGYKTIDTLSKKIMAKLQEQNGFIPVTDKTSPKIIADLFGSSKRTFKKTIGNLYKKRLIKIEKGGIRLQYKNITPAATVNKKASRRR